ncbi:hypothetical protein [Amnibacterium soli]|uniref:hypothetical protein n=1 Tax=Amnibacterium soli TaxID=1282736 RepID=UPI0031E5E32F
MAAIDTTDGVLNQYSRTWSTATAQPPSVPWAVPLSSAEGYRLIAFDFDAKGDEDAAAADAVTLADLLAEAGISHVICRSGPSGGRHVWTATTEAIDPDLVGTMARLASAVLPSLDIAPLRNSATGCVRPPGTPHRDGGWSQVLSGDLNCLLHPMIGRKEIEALVRALATRITGEAPPADSAAQSKVCVDAQGHPYLPGTRRPLPAASSVALQTSTADLDASTVLNTVLLGAAASHWHLADVAELVSTAPGLEHIRSKRGTRGRTARPHRQQAETLARQWRYAVRYVAEHPRRTGVDATFDDRAGRLADIVRALQEHADAAAGRWNRGGGPSDRRVLDCLHLWALVAVGTTVEADTRRVALACGIGRETARTALQRLAADGWITQAKEAAGVHGASWQIDPLNVLPRDEVQSRAQAATRPEGAGAAERATLTQQLQQRLDLATHDAFTGSHALPLAAGNLYARLTAASSSVDAGSDDTLLMRLVVFGLVARQGAAWIRTNPLARDAAAQEFGVAGRLSSRQERYQAERAAWSWWQAEHSWMCSPRTRHDARARFDQAPLWQPAGAARYPQHPRGPDGRANFHAARAAVRDGALTTAAILVAA